jgi:hypothetical protein
MEPGSTEQMHQPSRRVCYSTLSFPGLELGRNDIIRVEGRLRRGEDESRIYRQRSVLPVK